MPAGWNSLTGGLFERKQFDDHTYDSWKVCWTIDPVQMMKTICPFVLVRYSGAGWWAIDPVWLVITIFLFVLVRNPCQ